MSIGRCNHKGCSKRTKGLIIIGPDKHHCCGGHGCKRIARQVERDAEAKQKRSKG